MVLFLSTSNGDSYMTHGVAYKIGNLIGTGKGMTMIIQIFSII